MKGKVMPINKKILEKITSKTKIYLVIIFILLILICLYDKIWILPASLFYILLVAYTFWTNGKKKHEFFKHLQEITLDVDSAAKNTLINSPFPLVVLETDGNIIWKNQKFVKEFINVDIHTCLDEIIKEVRQDIIHHHENKAIEKEIEIGEKNYKIIGEYVKSKKDHDQQKYVMNLYFLDNTKTIEIQQKYKDSRTCIGIIMIDNYEEVMQRISTEATPQVIATVEQEIYNWVSPTGGLVIKKDRDTFIYVFEKKYLKGLKQEKFHILDTIKQINMEGKMPITLSIAITDEGETYDEKYQSALSAIDIALGRGGDQAVVREDGAYHFFGGRAQEVEKRTKVKARMIAHALEELMLESKDVMIMGHMNGDIDSMGSSLGLYRLAKSLGKEVHIVSQTADITLSNFIDMLKESEEYREAIIDKNEAIGRISPETLLIIVDTHRKNYVEVPSLLKETEKIVIIDHHRKSTEFIESPILMFHEVYASSTAELVIEILQYAKQNVQLTDQEIEALYGGIMVDTKDFTFKTGVRTFEAAAYLRKLGVDIIKVKKWFQVDLANYNIISDIVKKAEIINDTIAIAVYDKVDKNAGIICAKTADELITISDITASFVIGNVGDKICISGRSIGDINVQVVLEKLGGGGHITVAGAQLDELTLDEAKQLVIDKVNEYLKED